MSGINVDRVLLQNILGQTAFWVVNKQLARAVGLHAALMLADFISKRGYFAARGEADDGWFFQTVADIEEQTTLTKYQQSEAKKILKQAGLIDFEMRKVTTGERQYFFVNDSAVVSLLSETSQQGVVKIPAGGWLKNCTENKNKEKENKSKSNTITRSFSQPASSETITPKGDSKASVDSITSESSRVAASPVLPASLLKKYTPPVPRSPSFVGMQGSFAELEATDFRVDTHPTAKTVINTPDEAASFFDQQTVRDAVFQIMQDTFDSDLTAHMPKFAVSTALNAFCRLNSVYVARTPQTRSQALSQLLKHYSGGQLFKRMEDRRKRTHRKTS